MKRNNYIISIILLIVLLTSCDKKNTTSQKSIKIKSELSERIIDENLGISYQVPLDWVQMPASLSDKMVGRLQKKGQDEFIIYTPKSFYYNKENGSLLRVGEIKLKNNLPSDSLTIIAYSTLFQKYNRDLIIESTDIHFDKHIMKQLKISKKDLLSYKYLFKNHIGDLIQFDFSIQKKESTTIYPQILASIKSLKLL